jgi:peptidoglycan glycosyltransferase
MRAFTRFAALCVAALFIAYGFSVTDEQSDKLWLLCLLGCGVFLTVAWWPAQTRSLPIFNRTLLRWVTLLIVAFVLISIQLVRVQVVESARISNRVAIAPDGETVANPRDRLRALEMRRGRILDSDGRVLADTIQRDDGTFQRTYPEASTGPLIGYYSPLLYGSSNIEHAFDGYLSGEEGGNQAREWLDGVLHRTRQGHDLKLTIDLDLQKKADELLAGRPGAVVLLDAKTGAVLAMVGAPTFDPNQLYANESQQSDEQLAAVQAYWTQLNADPNAPLLFKPTQGLYNPGSTFKSVTATAAIDSGKANLDTIYRDEGALNVEGRVIEELNRPDPNQANWTLRDAYAYSLNVVFAQVGLQLGPDTLLEYAQRFGFGAALPFDFDTAQTQIASSRANLNNQAQLADTGFGQGEILTSPLQMAMVVQAIVNGGEMKQPYVVSNVLDAKGNSLEHFGDHDLRRVVGADTANAVRQLLLASADYGYAKDAQIAGATVGAKTGTAEVGEGEPHSWFTAFAEAGDRQLVVAVVVEHGGAGSKAALPIGRDLLAYALGLAEQ